MKAEPIFPQDLSYYLFSEWLEQDLIMTVIWSEHSLILVGVTKAEYGKDK